MCHLSGEKNEALRGQRFSKLSTGVAQLAHGLESLFICFTSGSLLSSMLVFMVFLLIY